MEGRSVVVGLVNEALLSDPLAFLLAEHARQKVLLSHLDRLARNHPGRGRTAMARALAAWFACELPVHLADEELSLYPRLRAHDSSGILARLSREHARDRAPARRLVGDLARVAAGERPGAGFVEEALRFAAHHRAHLATEEREVTPLARRALDPSATAALAAEMAERRAG